MTLVLASGSPRRREILLAAGFEFVVRPSSVQEREPSPGEDAAAYARELATHKTQATARGHPADTVLGADTVVTVDGAILNKPEGEAEARSMLQILRGRPHTVTTALLLCHGAAMLEAIRRTQVWMRFYSDREIDTYIHSGEPYDKAGGYAIQGEGGKLVDRIEGCYFNVVGLPLCRVLELHRRLGLPVPAGARCRHRWDGGQQV